MSGTNGSNGGRIDSYYDVIVVGGGPGGCIAAKEAALGGASAIVLEKDPDIGAPVRCAEGVSTASLLQYYEPDPAFCRQRITEYDLVAPSGEHVTVAFVGDGWILDRKIFDRHVAEDAARSGARIVTNANAIGARRENGEVIVAVEGRGEIRGKVLIGADGTEARAGRWLGLRTFCRPHDMETAAQYVVGGVDIVPHRIEMHFGVDIAPGGYFWVFPKGSGMANMGLGISGDYAAARTPFHYLDRVIARLWPNASILGRTMGGIACTGGVKELVGDNVMLVGDAAHQANPLTGGGITNAMKGGRIAGRVATAAIRAGDVSKRGLQPYEDEWDRTIGKSQRRFYTLKEGVFSLSDETLNELAATTNRLAPEKRTIAGIMTRALLNRPSLLLELVKVAF
jgi:digeranylgeranylglycerophospholipid reductase